jgi:hypothetical protein
MNETRFSVGIFRREIKRIGDGKDEASNSISAIFSPQISSDVTVL